ncbi:hypothetical protein [Yellowstone lake phycodnavirus 3]|uniref:hypothetical protein n=1 Tax=Yellowstone lake phycodnavirus 3 TaxID=1586715 RepID=UPI0006EB3BE0|nr:hypothetical protein AR677_gp223 [Yellowstone lake phycodnavirus 3]BAT22722.1 hypothetical protein [Yellowstone lake phycodnavirus 3]
MQEFIFGIIFGIIVGRIRKPPAPKRDAEVQADEVVVPKKSASISIQNSKIKYIPYLANFWGPDS